METTYLCEFPLYFPFFFVPERILSSERQVEAVRELSPTRETPLPKE